MHRKDSLGSLKKSVGESPQSRASNLAEVEITGPHWHPTSVIVGESPWSRASNLAEVEITGPHWHPTSVIVGESPQSRASNLAEVGITGPQWHPTTVRVGEPPRSRAPNSGRSQNHWASLAPNFSDSRGISPVLAFQFGPS
jgi:hypothetical protein